MYRVLSSPEAQRQRCGQVTELVTDYHAGRFNHCGQWDDPEFFIPLRERLYFALTFLRSGRPDAVRKANGILRNAVYGKCTFSPMIALQILIKYGSLLEDDAAEALDGYVQGDLDDAARDSFDYVGVNDNFPSMATFETLLGGARYHRPEIVECGKKRLRQFQALLTRRGVASEYNSPTYSPIQLLAMAEIANLAQDPAVRKSARQCEQRIWADLLGHLHPETSQLAGPYSRAYGGDSAGYTGLVRCSLYALLGDALPVNVRNTLLESEQGQKDGYAHAGAAFTQLDAVWLSDTAYDCPEALITLALNKKYPYEILASTEFSSSTDMPATETEAWPQGELANYEYPAGSGRIATYMTEEYALGTASHEFHNGIQTDSFHLLYRRRAPAVLQRDINTAYARYLVNDKQPTYGMTLLGDEGRKLGIQEKNSAMMLYKSKPCYQKGVSSLKLALVIPALTGSVEELWLGGTKMTGSRLESQTPCSVFIRDGSVYMAFHPLLLTDYGRRAAVTAEIVNGYLMVSFWNYDGPARDFTMREMLLTGNGFVAEIRTQKEMGSFENFRTEAEKFEVRDGWHSTVHSRFSTIRNTVYERQGLCLECQYSPVTEGIKHLAINGEPPASPKLSITGFDCSSLPFLH